MPIKDENTLVITRAAAGKLLPENAGSLEAPNDLTTVPELRVGGAVLLCSNSMEGVGISLSPNPDVNNIENAFNFNTFERATIDSTFSGNTVITVFFDQAITADTISISVHNLGSSQTKILNIFTDAQGVIDTVNWAPNDISPADNNEAIVVKVSDPVLVDELAITLNKIEGPEVFIGNILIGERLELPPIYGGHAPTSLNRKTRYESNTTGTGNWVGRSIKKTGYQGSFSFQYMDPIFVRDKVVPVLDCMERHPFVIQWRPDKFPEEAVYCWTSDDPQLSNMGGGHDLMQMSFNVEAYRGL